MSKKIDVVALGELLIDFTNNAVSEQGNAMYEANPGGAPCNVLSMLRGMEHEVSFIGKVGDDIFGRQLRDVLSDVGIGISNLVMDRDYRTTLAFVQNDATGDRSFSFYRNPGADVMLRKEEVDADLIRNSRIFHFGTLSMTHADVREATHYALNVAAEAGCMVSFDPNLRESLWDDLEEAKRWTAYGMERCDVLKISDNEITWFTDKADYDEGIALLQERYQIPLILLTMGKAGSRAYYKDMRVEMSGFVQKETIETTGAGDTFMGSCLHYVLKYGLDGLTKERLEEMLTFANAAASIITTRRGALKVMPREEEIQKLILASK